MLANDIMFLNFDDPSINAASFPELQKEIFKINPDISHIFLDEIQQKTGSLLIFQLLSAPSLSSAPEGARRMRR
ncbi:MAG: hypothetical protein IBX39_09410 [Candidatus Methanoperedenaceae archaeon]|nr:hypothetical protein [Candidatus Methanoperedenaceae archaeon]